MNKISSLNFYLPKLIQTTLLFEYHSHRLIVKMRCLMQNNMLMKMLPLIECISVCRCSGHSSLTLLREDFKLFGKFNFIQSKSTTKLWQNISKSYSGKRKNISTCKSLQKLPKIFKFIQMKWKISWTQISYMWSNKTNWEQT